LRSKSVNIVAKAGDPEHADSESAADDDEAVGFDIDANNLLDLMRAVADTTGAGPRHATSSATADASTSAVSSSPTRRRSAPC
jgi:hypothetical protein